MSTYVNVVCVIYMHMWYAVAYINISQQDRVSCSISLHPTPLRQGISVNLEFSW